VASRSSHLVAWSAQWGIFCAFRFWEL